MLECPHASKVFRTIHSSSMLTDHGHSHGPENPDLEMVTPTKRMIRAHIDAAEADKFQLTAVDSASYDSRRFKIMFALTGTFMIVEFVVGIAANSLALLADALHMLSDMLALGVGYYSMSMLRNPRSFGHTYGFARMEIVGALINAVFMLSIVLFIYLEAIQRFSLELGEDNTELQDNALLVVWVGALGLLINVLGMLIFSHGHGGHGHSHGDSPETSSNNNGINEEEESHSHKTGNLNMHGVLLHVMGDALGSVAVIITGLIVRYSDWEHRDVIDPICSVAVATIILMATLPLFKHTVAILLQRSPQHLEISDILDDLKTVGGVGEIHEFHCWALSSKVIVSSMHVVISPTHDILEVVTQLKTKLHDYGIHSSTIQPEVPCGSMGNYPEGMTDPCHDPVCFDNQDCLERNCCRLGETIDGPATRLLVQAVDEKPEEPKEK